MRNQLPILNQFFPRPTSNKIISLTVDPGISLPPPFTCLTKYASTKFQIIHSLHSFISNYYSTPCHNNSDNRLH